MTVQMFYAVALVEMPVIMILVVCLAALFLRDRSAICSGCGAPIDLDREVYWQCSHGHRFHFECADLPGVVASTCCPGAIGSDSDSSSRV